MRIFVLAVLAVSLGCLSTPAQAISTAYGFDYTFLSGEVLSGMLVGELQPDGDTVIVDSVSMISYSGSPATPFHEDFLVPPVTSFSGSVMQLFSELSVGGAGWQLLVTFFPPLPIPFTAAVLARPGPDTGPFDFFENEDFAASRWNLAVKAAPIPEPKSALLFGVGALVVSRVLRRQAGAAR